MMKILLVLLVCCWLVPSPAFAQSCPPQPATLSPEQIKTLLREAKDRGFLWKITNARRSGYLYGSIHVGKLSWSAAGPKTLAALRESDEIALELDETSIQQTADPTQFGVKSIEISLALQDRLLRAAKKVCVPMDSWVKQHPYMQLVEIATFDLRFAGFEVEYSPDIFIEEFARAAKKPVHSLETLEAQMRALGAMFGGESVDVGLVLARTLDRIENGTERALSERMAEVWANSNLIALQNYQKWCECAETEAERKALQILNDERNPRLAAGIDKLMRSGKKVFAAVGALHMTGPKALPLLLQHMGYKVERVQFEP